MAAVKSKTGREEIDAMEESAEPADYIEFYQRFRKWRDEADEALRRKA